MKKVLIFIICLIMFFGTASFVLAEGSSSDPPQENTSNPPQVETKDNELDNPLGTTSVSGIIARVIKAFLGIVGSVSLIMFIYAGFILLTSAGSSSKIKLGQQTMVWASLGILVIFASYALLKFVFKVIGL